MDRQQAHEELDLQLEAIQDVLAMAQQEPGRERQAELVAVAHRAFDVYERALAQLLREEQAEEQPRPILLLLKGGLAAVGAFLLGARMWAGGLWQSHQTAVLGGATGALAAVVGLVLYLTLWDGPGGAVDGRAGGNLRPTAMAPVSTPTRTAPPSASASASSPASTPTPSATEAPSTAVPASSPIAVSTPMGDATTGPGPGVSSPGATPPPGSPGPSGSPGGTTPPPDGGTTTPPPGGEQSDGGRCAVTLPVPLVDIRLGNLLCL